MLEVYIVLIQVIVQHHKMNIHRASIHEYFVWWRYRESLQLFINSAASDIDWHRSVKLPGKNIIHVNSKRALRTIIRSAIDRNQQFASQGDDTTLKRSRRARIPNIIIINEFWIIWNGKPVSVYNILDFCYLSFANRYNRARVIFY